MMIELAFVLAMPLLTAALIVWMIAAGYAKTDGMPPSGPNPYPERFDNFARWCVAVITVILYGAITFIAGPWEAAAVFAVLLALNAVAALLWTVVQELKARRESPPPVPFGTRLFRNYRDFYASLVAGILQG